MGRHKKIPTKNRKKLKACDPFNTKVTSWKVAATKKRKNWVPKEAEMDQPLTQNLRDLRETMDSNTMEKPRKRAVKNKAMAAAEKMGVYKGKFEDMRSFLRRVAKATQNTLEEHKIKMDQGIAARPQNEIDEDFKYVETKEKEQKERKKREVQNRIEKARKEKEAANKMLEEKLKAKRENKMLKTNDYEANPPQEYLEREQTEPNEEEEEHEETDKSKLKNNKKKAMVFGVSKKPPVSEALINRKEKIYFGERYDEPPKFDKKLKSSLDPRLTNKTGRKNLLLHSMFKKPVDDTVHEETKEDQKTLNAFERQQVIEAYRELKKRKSMSS